MKELELKYGCNPNQKPSRLFMKEGELDAILSAVGAEKGDLVLIVADKNRVVLPTLGALRLKVAKQLNIIPEGFNFLWITEFPFFEYRGSLYLAPYPTHCPIT